MKFGGAPGTLLACGTAADDIPCAIEETQYMLH